MIHAQLCDHVRELCDALHHVSRISSDGRRCWCDGHDAPMTAADAHSEACCRTRVAVEGALRTVYAHVNETPGYGFGV